MDIYKISWTDEKKKSNNKPEEWRWCNCFQYALTVVLNYQSIENHQERISNIKPFIDKYNCEGIDFPSHQDGQDKNVRSQKISCWLTVKSLSRLL